MGLLQVENLSVEFKTDEGIITAVDKAKIAINAGQVQGVIGESGSGKSVMALAIAGLLSPAATMRADLFNLDGHDLTRMSSAERQKIISSNISIIFQEPTSSLNPSLTIGYQLDETIRFHGGGTRKERFEKSLELLNQVGIMNAKRRYKEYPHQLSGGLNQRVMIAMALACQPKLLIADEPTTALDVTVQSQILDLLLKLNEEHHMALMLITHDFSILSETTDKVYVMYGGQIVESGRTYNLLSQPYHPYTKALLDSVPHYGMHYKKGRRLFNLKGSTPSLDHLPVGCYLGPRCPYANKKCVQPPELRSLKGRKVRCHFPLLEDDS
ncbi:ABC transporter ATP-binding protein [Kangiella shandongensis]|uniref:ABC transporter ATP-binding protein n=1 Tax=Kangiella shandongensis TaxID=2763258 RepID=UPI001CBE943B|nr:ABC transporter ATP-binding protein [Kangiella shandongensis]